MNLKNILSTYVAPVLGLLVLSAIFFYPQLQNKAVESSDISAFRSIVQETKEYQEETGEKSLWTNAIFGGMPTYQISGNIGPNLLRTIDRVLHLFIARPIGLFFVVMLCTYLSLLLFGSSPWVSFFGAAVIGLSVSNYILFTAGHMTKFKTIGYCVPVFMGLYLAYQRNRWIGAAVFGVALGLALYSNHPQMLYYMLMSLIVMGIIALVNAIKSNQIAEFAKTTGVLFVVGLVALASSASSVMPTLEYAKDTMRGTPLLTTKANANSKSSEVEGLDWEYATNWSNGVIDLVAGFVPGAAGGSSGETAPSGSVTVKNLQRKGARVPDDMKLPLYWGGMNSTGGAFYFGAVLIFLLCIQFFLGNKNLSIWLAASLILMAMLSMGRNLEWFNRFLFDHMPYFNNFRTPNSVSSVMAAIIGLGAAFGLHALVTNQADQQRLKQAVLYSGGLLGALALFFAFISTGIFDFTHPTDAVYAQQGFDMNDVVADRKTLMRNDALRTFLFILLSSGATWLYVTNKIKKPILIGALCVFAVIDLTGIGRRYFSLDQFQPKRTVEKFTKRPVDEQILNLEKDRGAYRVYDLSVNTFNSAGASYWYNQLGGYHPAKLQRYEDIKNYHLVKGNQAVLNMFNTKYIITREGQLQTNPGSLGNAWFVSNIIPAATNDEEIQALNNFNPAQSAVVHQEFNDKINGLQPTGSGQIRMTDYAPNKITYSSNTTSEELAVFSEVWYGPDKGWVATIDGQPADLIRVNYALRGLRVPAGNHEIIMEFKPATVTTGNIITLIASLLLVALALFVGYREFKKRQAEPQKPTSSEATNQPKVRRKKGK